MTPELAPVLIRQFLHSPHSYSIEIKKLSYKHWCKLACHAHVSIFFTGVLVESNCWNSCATSRNTRDAQKIWLYKWILGLLLLQESHVKVTNRSGLTARWILLTRQSLMCIKANTGNPRRKVIGNNAQISSRTISIIDCDKQLQDPNTKESTIRFAWICDW